MRIKLAAMLLGLGSVVGLLGYVGTDRFLGRGGQSADRADIAKIREDARYLVAEMAEFARSRGARFGSPEPDPVPSCDEDERSVFSATLRFAPQETSELVNRALAVLRPLGYRGEVTGVIHSNEGAQGEARRNSRSRVFLDAGGGTGDIDSTLGIHGCVRLR